MIDVDHTSNQICQTPAVDHSIDICTHQGNAKIKKDAMIV